MTTLPILDSPYTTATAELGRTILDTLGHLEPHIDETDTRCALPLRLVHNQATGCHLEIGPYALEPTDINRLRQAIQVYDTAARPGASG